MTPFLKNRAPLDAQLLKQELKLRHCLWQAAVILDEVTSTNDVAKELINDSVEESTFVVANFQTQGRGRQDRSWIAPKNSSIFISIILKPNDKGDIGWIPLIAGLSLLKSIEPESRKTIKIKWPNDLVHVENEAQYKFSGILMEKYKDHVIAGIGINYDQEKSELPILEATSLAYLLQNNLTKEAVIASFLTDFSARWNEESKAESWPTASLVREYKSDCVTLNKKIRAEFPGGEIIEALVIDISERGELIVENESGVRKISSADIHLIR